MAHPEVLVYVGGPTTFWRKDTGVEGIYVFRLNYDNGGLEPVGHGPWIDCPGYFTLNAAGDALYSVNEVGTFRGQQTGGVSAFRLDPDSGLPILINQVNTIGRGTCYIALDQTGRYASVANYGSGALEILPINPDGSVGEVTGFAQLEGPFGPDESRQKGPHGHSFIFGPDNRTCFGCDLGTDKVMIYDFDHATGAITPHAQPWLAITPGGGPRHLIFNAAGDRLYVNQEMGGMTSVFSWDGQTGALLQNIATLPADWTGTGNTTADLHFTNDGRFLYVTNRGHESIICYKVAADGTLAIVGWTDTQGQFPRNFAIDPTGEFMLIANQFTSNIVSFRINADTGALTPTGQQTQNPHPTCIKMLRRA
jgi:6-phosphogluconolactonase